VKLADERVDACLRLLLARVREDSMVLSGDLRVSEQDAANLLGYSAQHLKLLRHEGKGPEHYGRGMNGARVSYRLHDLAQWIEASRNDA
jgi:hypothetical protein